jgi:hypothetical protein
MRASSVTKIVMVKGCGGTKIIQVYYTPPIWSTDLLPSSDPDITAFVKAMSLLSVWNEPTLRQAETHGRSVGWEYHPVMLQAAQRLCKLLDPDGTKTHFE